MIQRIQPSTTHKRKDLTAAQKASSVTTTQNKTEGVKKRRMRRSCTCGTCVVSEGDSRRWTRSTGMKNTTDIALSSWHTAYQLIMNQGGKYVDTLLQLASQSNSLLTQKEVEQVDLLIDKCVAVLPECDKATFVRVLASFLRLFLYCPLVSTEVFYRRYYGILKEGFLFKTKNGPQ